MIKILILLFYWERPIMVRNALQSLKESTYENWELAFIDDGSKHSGLPVLREYFQDDPRIRYINTEDSTESKEKRGQSIFGKFANQAMNESHADVAIMLCDDDALFPDYLEKLAKYYEENPHISYSYSHITLYDPEKEHYKKGNQVNTFHNRSGPIHPVNMVDSSQVSWRLPTQALFPYPQTSALDAVVFGQLAQLHGLCIHNGIMGQYKGWGPFQLGQRGTGPGVWNYSG